MFHLLLGWPKSPATLASGGGDEGVAELFGQPNIY